MKYTWDENTRTFSNQNIVFGRTSYYILLFTYTYKYIALDSIGYCWRGVESTFILLLKPISTLNREALLEILTSQRITGIIMRILLLYANSCLWTHHEQYYIILVFDTCISEQSQLLSPHIYESDTISIA